jgi:hypothetical protein
MKKLHASLLVVFLLFVACASGTASQVKGGIRPSDVAGVPGLFCKVLKEPDPLLLGGWEGVHSRYLMKQGKTVQEPVQYWLVKHGDKYAIYFFRTKATDGKILRGWRGWTINGNEIVSDVGVRIFTQDGAVFYSWEKGMKEKPTQLTRIPGSGS